MIGRTMTGKHSIYGLAFSLLVLNGCASFQGNQLQPVKMFPHTTVKKTVDVDFTYHTAGLVGPDWAGLRCEEACIYRMKKSGLFGPISTERKDPDLQIFITLNEIHELDYGCLEWSLLSLFILPTGWSTDFDMKAVVRDTHSGQQSTILLNDRRTGFMSLFMIPVMPFRFPLRVEYKFQNRFFDNLCIEIYKTGILDE